MQVPVDETNKQFTNVQAFDSDVNFSTAETVVPAAIDAFGLGEE